MPLERYRGCRRDTGRGCDRLTLGLQSDNGCRLRRVQAQMFRGGFAFLQILLLPRKDGKTLVLKG